MALVMVVSVEGYRELGERHCCTSQLDAGGWVRE